MLQQSYQYREGLHPPLPQSLPAPTIRKTVPEHQSPLHQTAQQLFPSGCESPKLKSPRPYTATHRWVGLYKPPVATYSPVCALDTFHTLLCVHNPTKDSIVYVCLHAHALQITLHGSPASCLTYDASLCTCTVFIWSIRTVCIVCIF